MPKARPAATLSWLPWWLKGRLGRWCLRSTALVVLVGGFLAGVIWLGHWSLDQLHDQDRYLVKLADLDCDVPEGMARQDFLDEVQYDSGLPNRLNVLDKELPERLWAAFRRHPWVEKVEGVTVTPPRDIAVRLRFRTPVLAVPWDGELRGGQRRHPVAEAGRNARLADLRWCAATAARARRHPLGRHRPRTCRAKAARTNRRIYKS